MRFLLPIVAASALVPASCGSERVDPALIHTVSRGDMMIRVRDRGELHAAADTRVRSELEGRATLIHLVPEGSVVAQGDKLAELDASSIEEKRANQAITVAKAEAALQQARKSYEVMEKELEAAEKTAESRLQIAEIRVEKFLGEEVAADAPSAAGVAGTNRELVTKLEQLLDDAAQADAAEGGSATKARYADLPDRVRKLLGEQGLPLAMGDMANQVLQQIDQISLARADLELAEETLGYSQRLAAKGFITHNELDRDQINYQRQLSNVTVAWNNLQVLIKYGLPETLIGLRQEVENARLGLESVRGTNEARRVSESAALMSAEAEFDLAKEQLENYERQIRNAVIRAPTPGLVVYGRWDWDEPVFEGMEVRQRQEIVILPDVRTMVADLKIGEAQIDQVAKGQRATILVDAFPDRSFAGHVTQVATLPDMTRRSNDPKVFSVRVQLDVDNSDGTLRPGMNATIEVDVGGLRDVVQIPLPAVQRRGRTHYVWMQTPQGPSARLVELGGNNLTHVVVDEGLAAGDRIWLVQPTGARLPASLEQEQPGPEPPQAPADELAQKEPPATGGPGAAAGDGAAEADTGAKGPGQDGLGAEANGAGDTGTR